MAYAAWTKGTAAMLLAADETARAEGVEEALHAEWARSQPELAGRLEQARRNATTKGWRWIAEMEEIAATFDAAGQPDGFHRAAAEVYRRWSASVATSEVVIDELGRDDEAAAEALLDNEVGGRQQARLGEVHDVLALPGLAARRDGVLVGLVTVERARPRAELAVLAVQRDQRNRGIGAALVEAAADGGAPGRRRRAVAGHHERQPRRPPALPAPRLPAGRDQAGGRGRGQAPEAPDPAGGRLRHPAARRARPGPHPRGVNLRGVAARRRDRPRLDGASARKHRRAHAGVRGGRRPTLGLCPCTSTAAGPATTSSRCGGR